MSSIMIRKALILISIGLVCCKSGPPDKVQGIPNNAFWVGGKDGGQWYVVDSIDKSAQTIYCEIYNDSSGEIIASRKFKLHCHATEINWENLPAEFNSYDGEYLLLVRRDAVEKSCYFK